MAWDTDADQQIWYNERSEQYEHEQCVPEGAPVAEAIMTRVLYHGEHTYKGCYVCGVKFGRVYALPRGTKASATKTTEADHFL